jgi:hypothetical protein
MKSSYFWSVNEERQLGKLWREGVTDPEILAVRLKRKPDAIRKKLQRLGLVVGRDRTAGTTTNGVRITDEREMLDIPEELPTVEEALKMQMGALNALRQPNLPRVEIMRLRAIIEGVKIYKALFADYLDYRGIEKELVRIHKQLEDEKLSLMQETDSRSRGGGED